MPRRTHARLRRLLCLELRNARNWGCFFNGVCGTCSKWFCKLQCGCMNISTTMERTLAAFFANASACSTGKRALLAAHHSIPVAQLFAFLSSLVACFNLVMLALVAARPAARALARPRNARRALEPVRAARRLAASSSSRGASAARLPAVLPRLHLPAASAAPHRTHSRRAPVAAATACAPAIPATAPACHAPDLHPRGNQPEFKNRNQPKSNRNQPKSYGPRARPSLRARTRLGLT